MTRVCSPESYFFSSSSAFSMSSSAIKVSSKVFYKKIKLKKVAETPFLGASATSEIRFLLHHTLFFVKLLSTRMNWNKNAFQRGL